MKRQKVLCIAITLLFAALLPGVIVNAQTPREQLQQMVEQLQKTPTDNALRERVIKLAKTLEPPPAVPDEALRREGRGKFAFRNAKSNDDYVAAAKEYEEAVRIAPWINGYYSGLCTIYEKAEDYVTAKRNCEFSLIGVTDQSEINETKQRIAGLEFGIEKANSPEARKAAELQAANAAAQRFEGDWYQDVSSHDGSHSGAKYLETLSIKRDAAGVWRVQFLFTRNSSLVADYHPYDVRFVGKQLRFKVDNTFTHDGRVEVVATNEVVPTLSADGNTLELAYTPLPFTAAQEAHWVEWSNYRPRPYVDEFRRQ